MEIFNNTTKIVKNDLEKVIEPGSSVSMAAAYFSIYAYQELKAQLEGIYELKLIFTSPSFTTERSKKEKREFYIPQLNRERSLYGTEFEVKLRNELTQKAIAKECADWVRRKVTFKTNITMESMGGFINVQNTDTRFTYMPIEELKIHCAREHFKKISGDSVKYEAVSSYDALLNEVMR